MRKTASKNEKKKIEGRRKITRFSRSKIYHHCCQIEGLREDCGLEAADIVRAAIHYGLTTDPQAAGFILPDGRLLEVMETHERTAWDLVGMDLQQHFNRRVYPNEALQVVMIVGNFVRLRLGMSGVNGQIVGEPTEEQVRRLFKLYRDDGGQSLIVDTIYGSLDYGFGLRLQTLTDDLRQMFS